MRARIYNILQIGDLYVWLLFAVFAFLITAPMLLSQNAFGSDAPVHIRWQIAFAREFWSGTVFPRWLPTMNRGFGSPAFFFYPPALQWLGALFAPLMPGDASAMRRLALGLAILFVLGAQGCRCWIRALGKSDAAAIFAACVWLASPYLAFVDLYDRAAFAESACFALLPWLGFSAVRVSQGRRHAWGYHALAIAALAYAHMPGMVIGYLFAATHGLALVLFETTPRRRLTVLAALGTSALAGLALAGAMLVPALGLLDHLVDLGAMVGERNQPRNWLLFSHIPWIDHSAWQMTTGTWALTLIMTAVLAPAALSSPARRLRCVAWAMVAIVGAVAVLNCRISLPIWQLQTPLSRIQFPFRLFGASSLAVSAIAGIYYDSRPASGRVLRTAIPWLFLAGMLAIDVGAVSYQRLRSRTEHPPVLAEIAASTDDSSEYVLGNLSDATAVFGNSLLLVPDGKQNPDLTVNDLKISNRSITLTYSVKSDTALALHQFSFTGWECRIDAGAWTPAQILQLGRSSFAAKVPVCRAPAGAHRMAARLPSPLPETIGFWLSLFGAALVLGSFCCPNPKSTDVRTGC